MTPNASSCRIAVVLFALSAVSMILPPTSFAREAADANEPEAGTVRVVGHSSISAPADIVTLQIAVVTDDKSSQEAVAANGRRSNAALAALRKTLGSEAEVETLGFSLSPQYDYDNRSGTNTPALRNYRARNVVQVKTAQLERIGDAIDAAAAAGSNEIQSLQFGVRDPKPLQMRALAAAAADARQKAETIAKALDVEVQRVVSVEESNVGVFVARARMASFAQADSTPIEAGAVDVSAQLTLTVELAD